MEENLYLHVPRVSKEGFGTNLAKYTDGPSVTASLCCLPEWEVVMLAGVGYVETFFSTFSFFFFEIGALLWIMLVGMCSSAYSPKVGVRKRTSV